MNKKKIIKLAKKDFEKAWVESGKLLKPPHHDQQYPRLRFCTGKTHTLYDTIWEIRQAYLQLGFQETVNPLFIEEDHVYKQFGPEAPAVLDRCFYLAGLPRPDIGLGMDKIEKIESLGVNVNEELLKNLQDVFRGYKKGDVSGDDLVHDVSNALEIQDDMGLRILERVFPEIHQLQPVPSRTTLRSHMTSGWFISLQNIHNNSQLPLKLFSIDRCFRREQREDSSHLMTYHSASCVIVDENVSLDVGKAVSESLLEYFGFSKFKFIPDEKKSKYYIPETQTEVYGYHPRLKDWVEIATFGLYSPIALAKYGIDQEVMNLGVGAERIAMVLHQENDIREMVYPQIYRKLSLSDRDLATMLRINYYPVTEEGKLLMTRILEAWKENASAESPCEFKIFEGEFLGKPINLKAVEEEENTKLLGPAASNEIYIYNGNIVGVPMEGKMENELIRDALNKGIPTNISYIESLAADAAYKIEEMVVSGRNEITIRSTIARSLSDINLQLDNVAMKYITGNNKEIDIRGPIFSTLVCNLI
ncbi:O-phosphoserine--tRNA ligase [Methanobacterium alcaliphilum]|uniref:O-phosphoserine--tRNA ligase n=1 Tax=Methanobacterium alcaliphilum TaxID=392018 RepID=UPI00200AF019|nr:O-phosphoserine--tRNA ligase [Methanobacterium alcaliphilum]MCK9152343.1 O-phosphoserine--tRNA ligase [Methanobacterium alcaliphilum]